MLKSPPAPSGLPSYAMLTGVVAALAMLAASTPAAEPIPPGGARRGRRGRPDGLRHRAPPDALAGRRLRRQRTRPLRARDERRAPDVGKPGDAVGKRIAVRAGESLKLQLGPADYAIVIEGDDILLAANTGRARLYAAYDLLERLDCRWLAPQFAFYGGQGELIPTKPDLVLELPGGTVVEGSGFAIRKLDVEERLSHTTENLRQLVAWAPKLRYNTLRVPRDYGGRGRVTWDQ